MIRDPENRAFVLPQQKISQGAEVPQNPLAGFGMPFKLSQFVHHEAKRLLLPGRIRLVSGEQGLDLNLSFFDFTVKEMHELFCTLDGFKRRRLHFCSMQHSDSQCSHMVHVLDESG